MQTLPVIDTDTHLSEPPDLWTSRVSRRWGDEVPRPVYDERRGEDVWLVAGRRLNAVAGYAMAGWREYAPSHPPTIEEAHPAAFDARARVQRMDEEGILAEVIYPNMIAFSMDAFMQLRDQQLILECVRAYNDFLTEFASVAPERFVLSTSLPFWDVEASVAEIERCHEAGHRAINFMTKPYKFGLPALSDDHWEPILRAAEERALPINFHVGYQAQDQEDWKRLMKTATGPADFAKETVLSLMGLAEGTAEVLMGGVCHRYPGLRFVNVESGYGWLPYFLESADWAWMNSAAHRAHPERELPSFYFRRQVFSTFWFEQDTIERMADLYADNLMFETDFPHPTSLSPGPASQSRRPREVVADMCSRLPESVSRKIFLENAAELYRVDIPVQTAR
jgi:predicted TIM-barrel fold metal-dependent hydrolase